MDEQTIKHFWDDFLIPIQEKDPSVSFANPSDISRALVKARNWSGLITEHLINLRTTQTDAENHLSQYKHDLLKLEKQILSRGKLTSVVTKNKDVQKVYIYSLASESEQEKIEALEFDIETISQKITEYIRESRDLERMLRLLADSTDWLIQYLNWIKYEMRTLE